MLCNKALAMAKLEKRAISDPEHSTEVKQKDDLIKNLSCLLLRLEAEQKRQNFLGTAIHRWKYLGNFEWYILAKVYELQRSDAALFAFYEISRISGMEERRLKWHWRKLIKKGFLIEDGHEAKINHHIKPLIEGQQKKSLDLDMDLILFADFSETNEAVSPAKCIFNSSGEYNLYNQLIYLFPNDLIYPNMALQAIFEYDDMIRMLDKHDFEYYLKSMVDICIVATGTCSHTHWPVMGIEVDGPHHDNKVQRIRDERKNRIFDIGGVPLLRIRTDGNSAPKEVCRQLCEAIEAEVNHHWATDNAGLGVYWDTLKGALSRLSNEVA